MCISIRAAAAGFFFLGATFPLWAVSAAKVGHEPLMCVPACRTCMPSSGNARVVATFKLPDSVIFARVYFRREGQASDYFLEMRRGDLDRYWAVLPCVEEAGGAAVVYRVVGRDRSGNSATTPSIKAAISSSCAVNLSEEEHRAAQNIVLGLTVPGQTQNPIGFCCQGIVGRISLSGELRNVTPCDMVAGGKGTGTGAGRSSALTNSSADMPSTTAGGNPSGPPPPPPPPPPPFSQSRPNPTPN